MPSRKKKSSFTLSHIYPAIGTIIVLAAGFAGGRIFSAEKPSMLFVQEAVTGSFRPVNTASGTYALRLVGVKPHTLLFTDRPNRMVGSWTMPDFIARWSKGSNSFAADPPNAVLLSHNIADGKEFAIVVELRNPVSNAAAGTMTYDAVIVEDVDPDSLVPSKDRHEGAFPEVLRNAVLFIDSGECDPDNFMGTSFMC